jgi:hypothetical protein
MAIAGVVASRGSGVANLLSPDPKEVWADAGAGTAAVLTVDLGAVRTIDTVFLGAVRAPAAAASWNVTGGTAGPSEMTLQAADALRVPDTAGEMPATSHALWHGPLTAVRHLAIGVVQPAGSPPITAGVLLVGRAWRSAKGREWGGGRQPIDLGSATPLASGGFAMVPGARKRAMTWTFGDLTVEEAEQLEAIALRRGTTDPVLVIEDASRTAGLRGRLWYSKFNRWAANERRNRAQTRWEVGVEEWV